MDLLGSRRPRRRTSTAPWRRVLSPFPSSSSSSVPGSDLQESDVLWSHRDISSSVIDNGDSDVRRGNSSSSSLSSSYSFSSRPIPIVPTKKAEARVDAVARSEPIHIPRRRGSHRRDAELEDEEEDDDEENGKWLPPHEIVARTWEKRNMTCYSVLEGAGRTLKGRDLHRVRDAVLQQTGFFD